MSVLGAGIRWPKIELGQGSPGMDRAGDIDFDLFTNTPDPTRPT